ncbi:MAG: ABC transporter substrate-binding protein [Candidatus Bathyarchaeia archaeon]|nr:ABC transporter substrate-binding protein [Candidatus Bathyarchaeota archaeon]
MNGKIKLDTLLAVILILLFSSTFLISIPITLAQEAPKGSWVDEIVFFVEQDEAKVIDMLLKNEIQAYFRDITDPELFKTVKASPDLWYAISYGLYFDLTFNPSGPEFLTGELNPFSVPRIREAMNYLVDRKYICDEIMAGMAVPKYTTLTPAFPDYARYAEVVKLIEKEYSYNFDKAKEIITEEMIKLGAELKDGKWYYKGKPVTLIFIIRVEDQRRAIGDYIASQLEKLGFTVDRQYKTSREAAPIWIRSNPAEGQWHLYTGGWIVTAVSRDESDNFGYYYTPRGRPDPLWQAYKPSPEFDEVAGKLWNREFTTIEERDRLMKEALILSMKDSVRIWLVNQVAPWPARKEISLTYDLSGGFSGARLYPYTIRYMDKVGGRVKIATSDLLVEPVNPVAGSNWVYDHIYYDPLADPAVMPDPFTGLYWPQRIEKAEVYVLEGLPVGVILDWVSLKFVDKIDVPEDAWYDWDAEKQEIIYAPPGTTAKTKTIVYYDKDLFKMKYHDGSTLSLADFVFSYILTFDRAKPESPVYDEAYLPSFSAFREYFKGFRILSEDPLIIEYYSDMVYLDAEWIAADAASAFDPVYTYGPAPWHIIAIGWLAEANNELAFSASKAAKIKVEQANYIAGPALDILKKYLEWAINEKFIPYKNVLGNYVSEAEALERYNNLKKWYDMKKHFLVGNGPVCLESVDSINKIVVLKANREFPDSADKWLKFSEPMIPEVKVTLEPTILRGLPSEASVSVTFKGQPYKVSDIQSVKYLIITPTEILTGLAEPIKDGVWRIIIEPEKTVLLPSGTVSIDVIAVSKLVGMPSMATGVTTVMSIPEFLAGEIAKTRADYETKISSLRNELTTTINTLSSKIDSLSSTVNMLTAVAVVSIIIAIVALLLPLVRKK